MNQLEQKENNLKARKHPTISQVQIIENKPNFPISWLNTQDYCEYSIYLENFQHIRVSPNKAMRTGTKVHNKLETNFKKEATVATLDEIIDSSKKEEVLSREFFVMSTKYGIRGYIDEIWLMPNGIVIIDDKPGSRAYKSMINQVHAYALAYKETVDDKRNIEVALRTRGTPEIFWREPYTQEDEKDIIKKIEHMQDLISGNEDFIATDNPNKCKACRFKDVCSQKSC